MDLEQLKRQLLTRFADKIDQLTNVAACEIVWNPRMRSAAGRAFYRRNCIHLNSRLLSENPESIEHVFAHELAHLISVALYGPNGTGHGWRWRSVMQQLGFEPARTHSLDTSKFKRKHRTVAFAECSCTRYEIKPRRYRKMLAGAKYKCCACGQRLNLIVQHDEI